MALTINDSLVRRQYTATSGQKTFTVPFEFFSNADLKVYNGATLLTYSASPTTAEQYSVSGAGVEGGGDINLGAGGAGYGDVITILRDIPIERSTDYPTSGPFNIEALNTELAKIHAMLQQHETAIEQRSIVMSRFDEPEDIGELPVKADRANKYMTFDSDGNPSVHGADEFRLVFGLDILDDGIWYVTDTVVDDGDWDSTFDNIEDDGVYL